MEVSGQLHAPAALPLVSTRNKGAKACLGTVALAGNWTTDITVRGQSRGPYTYQTANQNKTQRSYATLYIMFYITNSLEKFSRIRLKLLYCLGQTLGC